MLFTMSDGGHKGTVKLHGPSRLRQLVSSFRGFVHREALPQDVTETPEDWADAMPQTVEESGIVITPILLHPPPGAAAAAAAATAAAASSEPASGEEGPSAKRRKLDGEGSSSSNGGVDAVEEAGLFGNGACQGSGGDGTLPPGPMTDPSTIPSLCYLMEMPPVPPKFNAASSPFSRMMFTPNR